MILDDLDATVTAQGRAAAAPTVAAPTVTVTGCWTCEMLKLGFAGLALYLFVFRRGK